MSEKLTPEEEAALDRYHREAIEEGIRDADAGRTVPHEEVVAWVESWGTDHELPMPMPKPKPPD